VSDRQVLACGHGIACDADALVQTLQITDFVVQMPDGGRITLPRLVLGERRVAALHAPSGAGKTALLLALFGLLQRPGWAVSGDVRLRGVDFQVASAAVRRRALRHDVAFLLQDAHAALDPLQPIGRQIAEAARCEPSRVAGALARLGIEDALGLCRRRPHEISGGQAQRALLAIAFLRQPALVVADEPSASLDGGSYAGLVARLHELVAAGSRLLLATHDLRLLRDLEADVYGLVDGAFVPAQPTAAVWPARARGIDDGAVVLRAQGVGKAFARRTVFDGVDLAVRRGRTIAVLGESGAGKTTLLRLLAGHEQPDRGRLLRPPRRSAVQLVCQDAHASLTPGRTLLSLLAEASAPSFDPREGARDVRLAVAALDRPAEAMSGGERRRAALLRALAVAPEVVLLDEPTASLDHETARAVVATVLEAQVKQKLGVVVVTHDEALAASVADEVFVLRGGRLCAR
jgi:peptide/nickel transport system ATP-binding protein